MIASMSSLRRQLELMTKDSRYALAYAMFLSFSSYTMWLSLTIIALVTLRRGLREGLCAMLPVFFIHTATSTISLPWSAALLNAFLTFLPVFSGALVLHKTAQWRMVAGVFFLLVLLMTMSVQMFYPAFIAEQFQYLQKIAQDLPSDNALLMFFSAKHKIDANLLANYLLGTQAAGLIASALLPLMLGRLLQARLFYPGGFRQEVLSFRSDKIEVILFIALIVGAYQQNVLAMNCLPVMSFYFLLTGLSLGYYLLASKKSMWVLLLLVLPVGVLPFMMMPIYLIIGVLDGIINFRSYLPVHSASNVT